MFGLKPRAESRAIDTSTWGQAWGDTMAAETWAGAHVTQSTAMQLLTVYGCVKFIADGIATLPLDEYRTLPDGTRRELNPHTPWLDNPTPDLDRIAWTTQVLTSLLLDGNAYLWVQRLSERDANVVPLDPKTVQIHRQNGVNAYTINGKPAGTAEIWHIPGLMMPGSLKGLSPVEMARQTIGAGISAEEFGGRQFAQGMSMSGVVEAKGPMPPEGPGSPRELARQFARNHSGKNKVGLPAVLVDATWKQTGVSNEQAQFLETRKFTAAQIAGLMFLIDPTDLGIPVDGTSLTYANLEQRNLRRVQVTYLPWIVRLEHTISAILGSRYVKFNVAGLLRGDLKTRFESYAIAQTINTAAAAQSQPPLLTTAEMREFEDLDPITLADTGNGDSDARQLSVAEVIQKVYLGIDKVVTSDEARDIINKAGGDLPVPGPVFAPATAARAEPVINVDARTSVDARHNIEKGAIEFRGGDATIDNSTGLDATELREQLSLLDPPIVNVNVPEQPPAEIRVEAPHVTVNVPEQPAPVVNIAMPERRKTVKTVRRDKEGRIAQVIED